MQDYKVNWSIHCHRRKRSRVCLYFLVVAVIGVFLAFDTREDRRRLISASGILLWVLLLALCSKHPRKIDWRQVMSLIVIQVSATPGLNGGHFYSRSLGGSLYNSYLPSLFSDGRGDKPFSTVWATRWTDFWPLPTKGRVLSLATWCTKPFSIPKRWTIKAWPLMSANPSIRPKPCPPWLFLAV